ncbi:hypothetical protein NKJ01_27550 [Mesorhizobium sp. M0276]
MVEGGAIGDAGVLHHLLQSHRGRAGSQPGGAGERADPRRQALKPADARLLPGGGQLDPIVAAHLGRFAEVGAIIGEYLGASAGLGCLIAQAEGNFDAVGVFAGIMILAIFLLIIDRILDIAEARLIQWSPHSTESRAT